MQSLKQSTFEYMSFMDMKIGQASAAKQKNEFELLSAKLAQPKMWTRSTKYLRASSERESFLLEINKVEDELKEISSEIMVEDSLMIILAAEMKELQAKMKDCRARMAAKKRNASQRFERAKSLVEQYKKLEVDDDFVTDLDVASSQQSEDWGRLRERIRSAWSEL
ncbi:unnamed protein product [Fraxinus pennsylvanica]|uniref:Uncharacterized protein n=1 Tax=Fraxinus pennsylvanica TaxID=56036 RepID=A0AAD1ZV76_9LAMI|nr:unnamed protein product [Fraxinus pennsylvanica]